MKFIEDMKMKIGCLWGDLKSNRPPSKIPKYVFTALEDIFGEVVIKNLGIVTFSLNLCRFCSFKHY